MQSNAQQVDNDAESLLSADDDVSISINRQTETDHHNESGVGAPFTFYDESFVNTPQRQVEKGGSIKTSRNHNTSLLSLARRRSSDLEEQWEFRLASDRRSGQLAEQPTLDRF